MSKGKPRKEEERFSAHFSEVQLNSVLLIILSATFLVQGIIRYLELANKVEIIRPWLLSMIFALVVFVVSVISMTLGCVVAPLKFKRALNFISFFSFILRVMVFLLSILHLIYNL